MHVIRPAALDGQPRWRPFLLAGAMLAIGAVAGVLVLSGRLPRGAIGLMAVAAALGIGVGLAWLVRAMRADPRRRIATELEELLTNVFDDAYTLVVAPRIPGVGSGLAALLVGPAGVRTLGVRRWDGRYRVRGRTWEFDAHGRRGWIACRTNPSFEVGRVREHVARWAATAGMPHVPVTAAVVFPWSRSHIVLEEPDDEIVTADNAPWWANRIGRVQRIDAAQASRFVQAVLDAAEEDPRRGAVSGVPAG
jgi:hypothetical protein